MERHVNTATGQAHVLEVHPAIFETGVRQASLSTPVLLVF
jgi:hypothetical protein